VRNKVIKSAIVIYTTLAVVLGICQYLGIPNLDIMSTQDRVVLGAMIWWFGVVGVVGNTLVAVTVKRLKSLAVVAIILCAIAAMIGGFHYYLVATWSQ